MIEESVADPTSTATTEPALADSTGQETLNPDTFDLAAWLAGMRPARRATTVYARPDLLADLDVLAERIQVARAASDNVEAARLVAQATAIRQALIDSSLDVVVQATSEERRATIREQAGLADGVEATTRQALEIIAAHIVEPAGMDVEALTMLHEASPAQVEKIARAIQVVNQTAPGVPAPFSPESSPARPRRG